MGGSLTTNVMAQYPGTQRHNPDLNVGLQDFDASHPGYATKTSKWIPDDPGLQPASAFFLVRKGGPVVYVRNFTVP